MGANIAAHFFLNSNWAVTDTCFKRNDGMSPIAADHPRQAFPLKSVVVGEIVMVGKVEPSSTLPITQIVRLRPSQAQCRVFPYDLERSATVADRVPQTVADRYRSYGNQALKCSLPKLQKILWHELHRYKT